MHEKYYKYWDRNAIVAAFVKDDPIMADVMTEKVRYDTKCDIAEAMLADGDSIERVARITGLTEEELEVAGPLPKDYHLTIAHDKGVSEGSSAKAREMAKAMLAEGLSVDAIARISGLTEEEIKAL